MTYSYALLFPVFLHKCRMTSGITRTFYIICSVMLGYIVMVAQYATALLIMLIGAIVYVFLISKQRTRVGLVLCVIGFGCILAITNGGADIIRAIARNVEGAWAIKLEDIALTLSGKGGADSVTARSALYAESVDAFIQSPLFGKLWGKTGRIGGHATAIDVLGLTGMAGFIVMIACICGNFSRMKNHPSYETAKPAVIAGMVQFFILIFYKNIVTSLAIFFVFFVFIPLLLKAKEPSNHESD